jgi:hypothetical protein
MIPDNPRFPHTCTIYRVTDAGPFGDATKTVVYEGVCRSYQGYRMTEPDGVEKEIFALSIPGHIPTKAADIVDIKDRIGDWHGRVKSCYDGNLGTTIHWENVKR